MTIAERALDAHYGKHQAAAPRKVGAVSKFIHDENLKLYRKQLSETMEGGKRQMLIRLIRNELLADLRDEPNATLGDQPRFP